jgi:hypothetical protein
MFDRFNAFHVAVDVYGRISTAVWTASTAAIGLTFRKVPSKRNGTNLGFETEISSDC